MIPSTYYHQTYLAKKQSLFPHPGQIKFKPTELNSDEFRKTFIGMESIFKINSQNILQFLDYSPSNLFEERAAIKQDIENPATPDDVRKALSETLSKLDDEIEAEKQHDVNKVSEKLDSYLDSKNLQSLKNTITSLFSTKAFTLFSIAFGKYSNKNLGGCYIASGRDLPKQICNLIIPENSKDPIKVVAIVQQKYGLLQTATQTKELANPVTLTAKVTYTIKRDGKVKARSDILLTN